MKFQWNLILGLFFALLVAVFAVANVASVTVNYLIGVREIPLILVIVGSALSGGLVVGMFGIFRQYKLQWKVKRLEKELEQLHADRLEQTESTPGTLLINEPEIVGEAKKNDITKNETGE